MARSFPLARQVTGALIALAVIAPASSAATLHDLDAARTVAKKVWPGVCDATFQHAALPGGLNAIAWGRSIGMHECTIQLDDSWPSWSYEHLCAIVVHEHGHLVGLQHVADPSHIMHPLVPHGSPAACELRPATPIERITGGSDDRPQSAREWVALRQRQYDRARGRGDRVAARRALAGKRYWQSRARAPTGENRAY